MRLKIGNVSRPEFGKRRTVNRIDYISNWITYRKRLNTYFIKGMGV